jgi:hypothetical protein
MVAKPEQSKTVPVHGQGQRSLPHGHLPVKPDRQQAGLDVAAPRLNDLVPQL